MRSRTSEETLFQFCARQVGPDFTIAQVIFDVTLGIILPVLCVYADPTVFPRGPHSHPVIRAPYAQACYIAIAQGILILTIWLVMPRYPLFFAGLLAGAGSFAILLGVHLVPVSVRALAFVIGFLGFAPFFTACVFWRNAVRAFLQSSGHSVLARLGIATLGFLLTIPAPLSALRISAIERAFTFYDSDWDYYLKK
jgi:hypothetical protein